MGNSSTFMSYCRSCSIVDDILAPTLEANFLVEKRTLESLFFNSTFEASVIQARNMKKLEGELTIQEHSVSRNEASIFQHFSTHFLAIFYLHFYCYENSHGNATQQGVGNFSTSSYITPPTTRKSPVATNTSRREEDIIIHRLARVVPRHKNAHRAHWFIL